MSVEPATSLPSTWTHLHCLWTVSHPCRRKLVEGLTNAILPRDEAAKKLNSSGIREIYTGPALRCPRRYLKVVCRLMHCGLVKFATSCACRVGIFTVTKKNDEQPFILDARSSSWVFRRAPKAHLASGSFRVHRDRGRPTSLVGKRGHQSRPLRYGIASRAHAVLRAPYDARAGDVGVAFLNGVAIPPGY